MSTKYLGEKFDIHGGGNDLKFPHHENEVAQNHGACGHAPAKYWLHGNMLLMNGRKMAKSDGNTITPEQLFTGDSPHISKSYSPMVLRFFMLQSHYRSTLDLTDDALLAAEKGYRRLMEANQTLQGLNHPGNGGEGDLDKEINQLITQAYEEMNDDFNTPKALARLFELVSKVNGLKGGQLSFGEVTEATWNNLKTTFQIFIYNIFGLQDEMAASDSNGNDVLDGLMNLILDMRQTARVNKDWGTSDKIRDALKELEIKVKDGKEGSTWTVG
jgi:cysteinyl-tRNA synthetase